MQLTLARFEKYQKAFLKEVLLSPKKADIIISTVVTSSDPLTTFMGASETTSLTYTFPILYEYSLTGLERGKPGISNMHDGSIYISPLQLLQILPSFRINQLTTKVILDGREYILDYVDYKEDLFDSCIAVELKLKDNLRG